MAEEEDALEISGNAYENGRVLEPFRTTAHGTVGLGLVSITRPCSSDSSTVLPSFTEFFFSPPLPFYGCPQSGHSPGGGHFDETWPTESVAVVGDAWRRSNGRPVTSGSGLVYRISASTLGRAHLHTCCVFVCR